MPVVVVATFTAKPESVDAVRDACTKAIEAVHRRAGLRAVLPARGRRHVRVRRAVGRRRGAARRTAPRPRSATLFGDDRRAPRRRPGHQDAAAGRRRRSGQGSAACLDGLRSTARSRSSPVPPAARAAPTRSSWPPTAPTSSRSTCATRSHRCPTRWPRPTISPPRSSSSRTPARASSPSEADVRDQAALKTALRRGHRRTGPARHRDRQRRHRTDERARTPGRTSSTSTSPASTTPSTWRCDR